MICFNRLDQILVCFNFFDPTKNISTLFDTVQICFDFLDQKRYVSTFSNKNTYVSSVSIFSTNKNWFFPLYFSALLSAVVAPKKNSKCFLVSQWKHIWFKFSFLISKYFFIQHLCFQYQSNSPDRSTVFRLCSTYVSIVLDVCFETLDRNWVCFYCDRPVFWLCLTYVSTFSTKIGYVLTLCSTQNDFRPQNLSHKSALARFSKLKHKWSSSTGVLFGRRGGFRGEGRGDGGGRLPFRDSNPCQPKGSPLWYFLRNQFLPTDPKNFSIGAFGVNIY